MSSSYMEPQHITQEDDKWQKKMEAKSSVLCVPSQSTITPIQGIQTNNHWSDVITKDKMHLLELIMCPEEQYGQFISWIFMDFLAFH